MNYMHITYSEWTDWQEREKSWPVRLSPIPGISYNIPALPFPCIMISPSSKKVKPLFSPTWSYLNHFNTFRWWLVVVIYYKLEPHEQTSAKFVSNYKTFHLKKYICKYIPNVSHLTCASKVLKDSTFWWWNQNILGVHWVNIMAADALAPCITRPSATTAWTMQDIQVLVFY